jgi:hypothetical protein
MTAPQSPPRVTPLGRLISQVACTLDAAAFDDEALLRSALEELGRDFAAFVTATPAPQSPPTWDISDPQPVTVDGCFADLRRTLDAGEMRVVELLLASQTLAFDAALRAEREAGTTMREQAEAWAFEKARTLVVERASSMAQAARSAGNTKWARAYEEIAATYRERPINDVFYPWAEPKSDAYRAALATPGGTEP